MTRNKWTAKDLENLAQNRAEVSTQRETCQKSEEKVEKIGKSDYQINPENLKFLNSTFCIKEKTTD